ncbi:unnamed protein product [Protopolystoma xenopodis]|uniref:SOCS box domain-containing protein n=1 Tax=Protopolystoma xenopodis TaxID=117903 RepID=A0A448X789_9PLAT|nr:unnamed protein product [Protopolystoma xenopodis]
MATPLHMAAKLDDYRVASRLLEHGAHPAPLDEYNRTPIDYLRSDSSLKPLIETFTGSVPSLQFITRLAIKRLIPSCDPKYVKKLKLPSFLSHYVSFSFYS